MQPGLSEQNSFLSSKLVFSLKVAALGGVFLAHGNLGREGEIKHRGLNFIEHKCKEAGLIN